jgi:hypothetical protein
MSARLRALAAASAALVVAAFLFWLPPLLAGDAIEYVSVSEALSNHGTPELRGQDLIWLDRLFGRDAAAAVPMPGVPNPRGGPNLPFHFWLYPLLAVPAKRLLHALGGDPLRAFQATNAVLFLGALYVALFHHRIPAERRRMFAALAGVGPVLWYLRWPHPEVFTWSCVVVSLVCLNNRRYRRLPPRSAPCRIRRWSFWPRTAWRGRRSTAASPPRRGPPPARRWRSYRRSTSCPFSAVRAP